MRWEDTYVEVRSMNRLTSSAVPPAPAFCGGLLR